MEQLRNIIIEYLYRLKKDFVAATLTGNATPELSFRPALDSLLVELANFHGKDINRIFEPRSQGKFGRPDWLFSNSRSMGIYGYIEAKGLNTVRPLIPANYEAQVRRYLYLGNPVILTDGIDFILYKPDGSSESVSLCDKPVEWNNIQPNLDIIKLFKQFFKEEGYRTISEKQLVSELSVRARYLCADLEEILSLDEDEAENETERETIVALKHLWDVASKSHDKSLEDNHTFAGFVAQIMAFSLLYAHRFINEKDLAPKEKYKNLHSFWQLPVFEKEAERLSPFKTLLDALSNELESPFSKLGIWYDNTRRLLSCIRLSERQVSIPNYHELYEAFLKEYDEKTRNDFGAWYTPMPLADYAVKFVSQILPTVIPGEALEDKALKIIDPCCGTGTFIEAVVKNLPLLEGSHIIGFEILPVPYALSNYRISMLASSKNYNTDIVLTNTLSDSTFKPIEYKDGYPDVVSTFFRNEQKKALTLSKPPITVIIGNPPCSDSASISNEGAKIKKLMKDFRPKIRTSRSNKQKQITNEMSKFLRWSLFKAEQSRPSVFALVLPSTFVNNISFKAARKFLLEHVSEMWVLEFDVDNRAGHQAENLFNTLQGRLLLIGTLKEINISLPTIHYKSICSLSYNEKIKFLNASVNIKDWKILKPNSDFILRPIGHVDETMYSQFWHIASESEPAIFLRHCSGLKLAPTHMLVHFNKGQLKRRNKFISEETNSYEEIRDRWYKGQTKPPTKKKLSHEVRACLANSDLKIVDYSFRPFLTASLIFDNAVMDALRKTEGGGMRERPEIQAAYADEHVFGFAAAPAPADISPEIKKFTSFCWNMPDNDLATRGNAHVFCNKFPEYKKSQRNWSTETKSNINEALLKTLSKVYHCKEEELGDNLVFYTYAALNSELYLTTFEGKLYSTAGEWASIPITESYDLFVKMVDVGKNMSSVEKKDYTPLQLPVTIESEHFDCEIEMSYSIEKGNVIIKDINTRKTISIPVSEEILTFQASGYEIVREWLKYHSYNYYRKSCGRVEFEDFQNLCGRIYDFKELMKSADEIMDEILQGSFVKPIGPIN